MTGGDGHVPPLAPLHAGTGPIGGFSTESGGAGGSDVGKSTKPGKELALAGGSSTSNVGSPPPPSRSLKGREVKAVGGEKKRKKAVLDDPDVPCSKCPRLLSNLKALFGHLRMQVKEVTRTWLNLGQTTSNKIVGSKAKGDGSAVAESDAPSSSAAVEARRKEYHKSLDLNKKAPEDDENDDEDYGGDDEGA